MKFGYGRVSKLDQNPDLQVSALMAADCEKLFIEKISAGKKERPQWLAVNDQLRAGDTLVVWKLDRLARSVLELAQIAEDFKARGVNLHIIPRAWTPARRPASCSMTCWRPWRNSSGR